MVTTLLINILLFSLTTFSLVTFVYFIALAKRHVGIVNITYGALVAISMWAVLVISEMTTPLAILIACLTSLWAVRQTFHTTKMYLKDNRTKPEITTQSLTKSSYVRLSLAPAVVITLSSLPFLIALSHGPALGNTWTVVGIIIMLFGLLYETIADWQLSYRESTLILSRGLFRFHRLPNYFGETLVWLGLALIAAPLSFGPLAFISPLLMTYIRTKVTGPAQEQVYLEKYPESYRTYMSLTNYFLPGRHRQ